MSIRSLSFFIEIYISIIVPKLNPKNTQEFLKINTKSITNQFSAKNIFYNSI